MNWKKYEKEIFHYFHESYHDCTISFDKRVIGRYSKVERQIDILIEGEIAGYKIKIIVDCKCFSKKIDVKQVESFVAMIEDLDAHQGILITQMGYSKAAINRAYYGNQKVELDVINFDEIKKYQGFLVCANVGHFAVMLLSPFGWVLDLNDKVNSFATLFQRGLTLKEAQKKDEWMYFDFWVKKGTDFSIDKLIEFQNINLIRKDKNAKFEYSSTVRRIDGLPTKIRIADIHSYPALEVTGFIEFEGYILFIVLITPRELLSKNLRKLEYLLSMATPTQINFDHSKVIEQLNDQISQSNNIEEKAEKHHQIGIWYKEMDDFENALMHFTKMIEYSPNNFEYLKSIIAEELAHGTVEQCLKYCSRLFELDHSTPRNLQGIIKIFHDEGKVDPLIQFLKEKSKGHLSDEILGIIFYNLGILKFYSDKIDDAFDDFAASEKYFKKVFKKDHEIFRLLESLKKSRKQDKLEEWKKDWYKNGLK